MEQITVNYIDTGTMFADDEQHYYIGDSLIIGLKCTHQNVRVETGINNNLVREYYVNCPDCHNQQLENYEVDLVIENHLDSLVKEYED